MAVGDFTPNRLAEINLKMEEMWAEPQKTKNYSANGETIKAILENQTAEIAALEDPEKIYDVSVNWIDFCANNVRETSNADECPMDQTCNEGEGKSKNYALDIFLEDCFAVNEDKLETTIWSVEEVIAKGLLKAQKDLIERFNQKAIAVLIANLGDNPIPAEDDEIGVFNPTTNFTSVQRKDFNIEEMYPYFSLIAALQKSNDAFVLDGGNLYKEVLLALKNNPNDNGKLDLGLLEMFPFYQDLFGINSAGQKGATFLIDRGSVAVATRSKYPEQPREIGGNVNQTRYSMPLEFLPGVSLDVAYQPVCANDTILHKWNLKLRAGVFVNPTMCNAGNTGILGFKKVADVVA
jgi:hypothetical protein